MKKFVLGALSVIVFLPILENLTEVVCQWLEVLKIESGKKIMIGNNELADLQSQLEPIQTQCIGFQAPSEEYYEDDWEEDKIKNKIGFV